MNVRLAIALGTTVIGVACMAEASWIHVKALVAQELISAAWDRTRRGAPDAHPWPWADTTPVARLTFFGGVSRPSSIPQTALASNTWAQPQQGDSFIILEGASGRNLAFGPTHDAASVLPGDDGNSVIAAHRDTHFRVLEKVRLGDRLRVERADGRVVFFSITAAEVADSRHTRIALNADAPRLTLVTCYPFNAIQPGGPLRFVVTADLIAGAGIPPPLRVAHAAAPPALSAAPVALWFDWQKSPAALLRTSASLPAAKGATLAA